MKDKRQKRAFYSRFGILLDVYKRQLQFDREKARGKRLDIPAGTAIRFEPGETKTVQLIDFGGKRRIFGFNNKVNGFLD